jgi:hypothetical protein
LLFDYLVFSAIFASFQIFPKIFYISLSVCVSLIYQVFKHIRMTVSINFGKRIKFTFYGSWQPITGVGRFGHILPPVLLLYIHYSADSAGLQGAKEYGRDKVQLE